MNIEYTLKRSEFINAKLENKYKCKEFRQTLFVTNYIICFILVALMTIIIRQNIKYFLIVYLLAIFILPIIKKQLVIKEIRRETKYKIYKISVTINDNDILMITNDYKINLNCNSFMYFVETNEYIHIYSESKQDIFIPIKAFENDVDKNNFIGELNTYSKNVINK